VCFHVLANSPKREQALTGAAARARTLSELIDTLLAIGGTFDGVAKKLQMMFTVLDM
jgi:hypothetical protein